MDDQRVHAPGGRGQHIPLPLGGPSPVRVDRPRRRARWRLLAFVIALACAGAGSVLLAVPSQPLVYRTGDTVTVGAVVLHAETTAPPGVTLFSGAASLALVVRADGSMRAAASWRDGGVLDAGTCELTVRGATTIESCRFSDGADRVTARDTLDRGSGGATWERTYSDGRHTTMVVPAGRELVPVAFPVGR